MTTYHENLKSGNLHVPGYINTADPGVVGSGILWIDKSGGADGWISKIRNDADDNWEIAGVAKHADLTVIGDGSDHTFIDQSVISGSSPFLDGTNFTGIPAPPYGIIAADDETITCTTKDTWYQVTFDVVGDENLMVGSIDTNDITISITGIYDLNLHVSIHSAAAQDWEIKIAKNNNVTDLFHSHLFITTGVSGKTLGSSVRTIDELTAADTIEIWVRCTSAASKDAIFDHIGLAIIKIGV